MDAVVAIVLGAGSGARVGMPENKMYLRIGGEPILVHAVRAYATHPLIDEVHVVAAPAETGQCRATLDAAGIRVAGVLAGGATRHASERGAVEALAARVESGAVGLVVIHDGARPLVEGDTITRTVAAAREHGAAIAAMPVERPLAVADAGVVTGRHDGRDLWRAQTPQAFAARALLAAFRRADADGFEGSDTAMSVERLGGAVRVVRGTRRNFKVTYPIDLLRAEALLAD